MQRRNLIVLAAIVAAGLIIVLAIFANILRPTEAPSGEITAAPIVLSTPEIVQESAEPTNGDSADSEGEEENSDLIVFEIVQAESEVRFTIDEILRGQPNTVVGRTNQLAAQLIVDPQNPSDMQLGVIQINARTLVTDNETRNRAIRNWILETDQFELIIFTPTELIALPQNVSVGDSFDFQIVGDFTIRHITQQVSFDASVTVESLTRLIGLASATILRADFELTIPQVPVVGGVEENVFLEIDFVALAQ